jgi:hypothetical protein
MKNNAFEILKTLNREELKQNELELKENQLKQYEEHPQYELIKKANERGKLAVEEQIEYLKFKGITFNYINEFEASEFLNDNSYYYKVTAFRKNFAKNSKQKYENLEFATIRDLATIDMHLRYLLLKLSLDVEHSIKTKLIKLITTSDEDGYSIIEEYDNYLLNNLLKNPKLSVQEKKEIKDNYVPVAQNIMKDSKNPKGYHKDLFDKHHDKPSIWVLIELMSYGSLANFTKFYVGEEKFGYTVLKDANDFIHFSKNIRDSAAHSRPILFNIIGPEQFKMANNPKIKLKNYLVNAGLPKRIVKNYLMNVKVHDLCSLLFLHDSYITGSKTRRERKKELISLLKRSKKEKKLYPTSIELDDVLLIFGTLIMKY